MPVTITFLDLAKTFSYSDPQKSIGSITEYGERLINHEQVM